MPSMMLLHRIQPEPSTSWIVATSTAARLYVLHQADRPSSSRVPSRTSMLIVTSIRRRRIARPASFATRPSPWTASTPVRITPNSCGAGRFKMTPAGGKTLVFITNNLSLPAATGILTQALQKPLAGGTLLQVDQAAIFQIKHPVLRHAGERGEDADLDCRLGLRLVAMLKKRLDLDASALHFVRQILSNVTLFEKMLPYIKHVLAGDERQMFNPSPQRPNRSKLTGLLTGH